MVNPCAVVTNGLSSAYNAVKNRICGTNSGTTGDNRAAAPAAASSQLGNSSEGNNSSYTSLAKRGISVLASHGYYVAKGAAELVVFNIPTMFASYLLGSCANEYADSLAKSYKLNPRGLHSMITVGGTKMLDDALWKVVGIFRKSQKKPTPSEMKAKLQAEVKRAVAAEMAKNRPSEGSSSVLTGDDDKPADGARKATATATATTAATGTATRSFTARAKLLGAANGMPQIDDDTSM